MLVRTLDILNNMELEHSRKLRVKIPSGSSLFGPNNFTEAHPGIVSVLRGSRAGSANWLAQWNIVVLLKLSRL